MSPTDLLAFTDSVFWAGFVLGGMSVLALSVALLYIVPRWVYGR